MFLKTSFFRWWLATCPFFLLFVVLCFICHFYNICWKNLGKRPAVEPSDFWENRTRFQKQCFFLFCFFTFAFFILFHIFVNFRLPLPPPLAQIGFICGRCWSHFCSVLVEVGERSRVLELFGTQAANKTHTHTTTPQPHNTTCNLVWHRTARPRNTTGNHTHKHTNRRIQKTWPGGMRARAFRRPLRGTACQIHSSSSDQT